MLKLIMKKIISSGIVLLVLPAMLSLSSCYEGEGDLLDPAKGINKQGGDEDSYLQPPSGLWVSKGDYYDKISLNWTVSYNIPESYHVERSRYYDGNYVEFGDFIPGYINSVTDFLIDQNAVDYPENSNGTWYYRIRAYYSNGVYTAYSEVQQGNLKYSGISAPKNVQATEAGFYPNDSRIFVSWEPVSYADYYYVYRYDEDTNNPESYTDISNIVYSNAGSCSWEDWEAVPGRKYYYRVKAGQNFTGATSIYSRSDSGEGTPVMSAPQNVSATDGAYTNMVRITWDEVYGATSYNVYRDGTYIGAGYYSGSYYYYDDNGISTSEAHAYTVRAVGPYGESAENMGDSGNKFGAPTGLTASDGDQGYPNEVNLTWNMVGGAVNHFVERSEDQSTWDSLGYLTSPCGDATAEPGKTYYYRVTAVSNLFGNSSPSNVDPGFRVGYAIIYNRNDVAFGGSGYIGDLPVDNVKHAYNESVTLEGNTGNLAGHEIQDGIRERFLGWSLSPGVGSTIVTSVSINGNITVYAQYTYDGGVLRKVGPAGGWVFYDAGSTQSWGRYLEAANEDLADAVWGTYNFIVTGADGDTIGTGSQNTVAIVGNDTSTENKAANYCDNYTYSFNGNTSNNWFLPSRDEMVEMRNVLFSIPSAGFQSGNYYWTSTQLNEFQATVQYCDPAGSYLAYNKNVSCKVRAIRAF